MEHTDCFTEIVCAKTTSRASLPLPLRLCPGLLGEWGRRKVYDYFYARLPACVQMEELEVMGVQGLRVTLPFTREELLSYAPDAVERFLGRLADCLCPETIVTEEELEHFFDPAILADGKIVPCLLIRKVLENVAIERNIVPKHIRLAIIDSGQEDTSFLLGELGEDLNALTIATHRPDYFGDWCEKMLGQTGLPVHLAPLPLTEPLQGNIIIDLCCQRDKSYRWFERGATVLYLWHNADKARDLSVKRKDVYCHHTFQIFYQKEEIPPKFCEAALRRKTFEEIRKNLDIIMPFSYNTVIME